MNFGKLESYHTRQQLLDSVYQLPNIRNYICQTILTRSVMHMFFRRFNKTILKNNLNQVRQKFNKFKPTLWILMQHLKKKNLTLVPELYSIWTMEYNRI